MHAKRGSIVVKEGQKVVAGQKLGTVGNSGGSAIPHLHVTLVAYDRTSVPWACQDYTVIAPDGTPLRVTRACPRESWIIVGEVPAQPTASPTPAPDDDATQEGDGDAPDGAD